VALSRELGTVTANQLGGVCVFRCQLKKRCEAGFLVRFGYGRYQIGPNAAPDDFEVSREVAEAA